MVAAHGRLGARTIKKPAKTPAEPGSRTQSLEPKAKSLTA